MKNYNLKEFFIGIAQFIAAVVSIIVLIVVSVMHGFLNTVFVFWILAIASSMFYTGYVAFDRVYKSCN